MAVSINNGSFFSKIFVLCEIQGTNRTLLHWLKLWDKVVFNRERKVKQRAKVENKKGECTLEGFWHSRFFDVIRYDIFVSCNCVETRW